jgi:hypothetical protein
MSLIMTFPAQGIGAGIDGLVLEQVAAVGGTAINWVCGLKAAANNVTAQVTTNITSKVALKYYGCV